MAKIEMRPMLESDLYSVDLIEKSIYEFPWSMGNFRDSIRAGYEAFCMWHDINLLGYCVMMKAVDEMHLLNLSIRADSQGKGLGRRLLKWCLAKAKAEVVNGMVLEVRPSNLIAQNLYKSEGFKLVGVRKHYYPAAQGREDALVLLSFFDRDLD